MTNSLTASDIMALNSKDGFLEGNGIIILILFFLLLGGNGLFGKTTDTVTTAQMYSALNNQNLENDVRNGFTSVALGQSNIVNEIQNNKYENLLQFKDLMASNDKCCCELKSTIIEQNQATRDLIQANYVQRLESELSDKKNEIALAELRNSILNTTGKWYANPSATTSTSV